MIIPISLGRKKMYESSEVKWYVFLIGDVLVHDAQCIVNRCIIGVSQGQIDCKGFLDAETMHFAV